MRIEKKLVKRILVIQPRGLGDIVLSTVLLRNLADEFPDAVIDYLTQTRFDEALVHVPLIRDIITYRRGDWKSEWAMAARVRKKKYDLVIDLFSNPRTSLVTFLSGARYRAGKAPAGRGFVYNLKRPDPPKDVIHQVDRNRDFLASMGIRDTSQELFFGIGEEDRTFAESYFKETFEPDDCVIGLLPCGSWPSKKCDPVKLAEFGDALLDTFDTKLLLIWGPEEEHEAQAIREFMSHQLVLPPLTSIREMGALLEKCSFVVANDSGPMHISVAVGTPVISLQGPTDPRVQGPYGRSNEGVRLDSLDCIGCHRHVCPKNHECFMDMPAERVIEAAERIIERNNLAIRRKDRK